MSDYHELNFNHRHEFNFSKEYEYMWIAPQEFKELPDRYEIEIDVPSFTKEDLEITFKQNKLHIFGYKEKHLTKIRPYREVRKELVLKEADETQITGKVENGVLYLTVMKKEEFIPKLIKL